MQKKLKLIFIGGWGHGSRIVNLLEKGELKNVEVVGLGQTCLQEPCWSLPEKYDSLPRYQDYRQLLSQVEADVAVISTRLQYINQAAIDAAAAGCHLLVEKPIAANYEQLHSLYEEVAEQGVELLLLLDNRAHPYLRAVRCTVTSGIIGRVLLVNARKSYPWYQERVKKFPVKWGGTIGWVGIHALDFINFGTLLKFKQVIGMESNQLDPDYASCPDNSVLLLELSNGSHASISLDYHRPQASSTHGDDWLRVVGTKGTIEANLSRNRIYCCTDGVEDRQLEIPPPYNYFQRYFDYLNQGQYINDFSEMTSLAFHMTATCITAQQAVQEGQISVVEDKYDKEQ